MPCISIPTALAIAGTATAGASVAGGLISADAARSAGKTQAAAADKAAAQQEAQFASTTANVQPFVDLGKNAIPGVENLLGIGGPGTNGVPDTGKINSALENLPGYQFTKTQGLQAVQNGYAAQGLGQSGPALKGAAQYAEGLAGTQYESFLQNYLTTVAGGQNAATNLGSLGANAAQSAGNFSTSGAAATAAGTVGSANALTTGLGGLVSGLTTAALGQSGIFGGTQKPATQSNPLNSGWE